MSTSSTDYYNQYKTGSTTTGSSGGTQTSGNTATATSDASAANQVTQITRESEIRDRLQQFSYRPLAVYNPSTQYGVPQLHRVVDPSVPPAYNAGELVFPSCDMRGALLVNPGISTESTPGAIAITSNSTAYVPGNAIDLRGYDAIAIIPTVTTAGGTAGTYKIQWSFDNASWWDEVLETSNTPSGSEVALMQNTIIRTFASGTNGLKPAPAVLNKKGRYVRVAQRSDSAVSLVVSYSYQLL